MARLHHYTGVDVELPLGEERVYGRADTNLQLEKVSRQQFRLACTAQGLLLTSLGANPTKVWLGAHNRTQAVLLQKGETRLLSAGDRVLLLGCDPSMFVEVKAAPVPAETGGAAAADGAAAEGAQPPSKRLRVETDAAATASASQQQQQQQGDGTAAAAAAGAGPVLLVLVGAQGAGKSTFCHNLKQATERPGITCRWARVNQDTIANGRPGKREQCVEAAQEALDRGESVLIDRTNVTPDQRRPFIAVARQKGVPAHCLVLKLSRKVCGQRAAARDVHEGGLHGHTTAVYQAVNRMWSMMEEAGDPQEREGFASVIVCENDKEVAAALDAWAAFGPAHPDPAAEYQRRRPPPPKVNTLFNYLKKATASGSGGSGGNGGSGGGGTSGGQAGGNSSPAVKAASGSGRPASAAGSIEAAPQQQQQQQQPAGGGSGSASRSGAASASRSGAASGAEGSKAAAPRIDAFQLLMHPPKPGAAAAKAGASSPATAAAGAAGAGGSGSSGRKSRHTWTAAGPFASSLASIAANPESCRREQPQLWFDDRCVWIADKYAKAREHWLLVAREPRLEGPLDLTAADIPLLEHMLAVARERTQAMQQRTPGLQFRYGFHSLPSLRQLHMHVVSQDFDSPALKNKKHWQSFTSSFFLDAEWVLGQLRQAGRLDYSLPAKEALLKSELRCHRCGAAQPNMPRLKEHIAACRAPVRPPQY